VRNSSAHISHHPAETVLMLVYSLDPPTSAGVSSLLSASAGPSSSHLSHARCLADTHRIYVPDAEEQFCA
jgi:hypothetical protein